VLSNAPTLAYQRVNGKNPEATVRDARDAEMYALRPIQLVLPVTRQPDRPACGAWPRTTRASSPASTRDSTTSRGPPPSASSGSLASSCCSCGRSWRREAPGRGRSDGGTSATSRASTSCSSSSGPSAASASSSRTSSADPARLQPGQYRHRHGRPAGGRGAVRRALREGASSARLGPGRAPRCRGLRRRLRSDDRRGHSRLPDREGAERGRARLRRLRGTGVARGHGHLPAPLCDVPGIRPTNPLPKKFDEYDHSSRTSTRSRCAGASRRCAAVPRRAGSEPSPGFPSRRCSRARWKSRLRRRLRRPDTATRTREDITDALSEELGEPAITSSDGRKSIWMLRVTSARAVEVLDTPAGEPAPGPDPGDAPATAPHGPAIRRPARRRHLPRRVPDTSCATTQARGDLSTIIYSFHMPLFILVSGYLRTSPTGRPGGGGWEARHAG